MNAAVNDQDTQGCRTYPGFPGTIPAYKKSDVLILMHAAQAEAVKQALAAITKIGKTLRNHHLTLTIKAIEVAQLGYDRPATMSGNPAHDEMNVKS